MRSVGIALFVLATVGFTLAGLAELVGWGLWRALAVLSAVDTLLLWWGPSHLSGGAFESLLGALYLQMAWLLVAKEEVRCKQCDRVINYEQPEIPWEQLLAQKGKRKPYKTRSDKEFCSKSCADKWYYEKVRKPRLVRQ